MPDLGLGLLRNGYDAIAKDRERRGGGATYPTRLLGRRTVVLAGEAGARLFYDERIVRRRGAVPPPLAWLLFGRGAVHGLDGEEHRERKQLFLGPLQPGEVLACASDAGERLRVRLDRADGGLVHMHDTLAQVYGQAVLDWAGVETTSHAGAGLGRAYAAIVDGFGFAGPAYLRAWRARRRTDAWARRVIDGVRSGRRTARPGTVLALLAATDLDVRTAAVELGNVLRPTVATAWLGAHATAELARSDDPGLRRRLVDEPDLRWSFAQEVRRTTPFVPALAGRVRSRAELDGVGLGAGDGVVLDVPGINLSRDLYREPHVFRPDRFVDHDPGPFALVPQGGGFPMGHRCPGESLTTSLLVETVRVLALVGARPAGSTAVDRTRIPTLPASGPLLRIGVPATDDGLPDEGTHAGPPTGYRT